ncbi:MAG: ATP-dependent DNA helicase UvrD2 [Candidatus Nanopelagicales bacterium]
MTASPLDGLDDEQRAVAEALHGPVVVLAGAGTGKTRAITHRIAHGARTGAHDPRRTLAVTFTTRAAGEMRGRLRALGVDGVQVRTFHAAALRQLRYFWPRLSSGAFPELLPSKSRLVAEAASRCRLPTDTATVRDLASDLEWAKVNFLSGARLAAGATQAGRTLSVEPEQLAAVQEAYERAKDARSLLDFEDVLLVTAGALGERPDIADEVRSTYRWFTVDEFQDVNPLQHRLLTLWLGDRDDVCVVGDANQTIYSFTGASPAYLTGFRDAFADATEVRLVRCYRCTPQVVELANRVIAARDRGTAAAGSSAAELRLVSQRPAGEAVEVRSWADDVEEAQQVAARIRRYLDDGVPGRDIAVLFRVNAQSAELESALSDLGIAAQLRGTERYFERPEVREGITRLRGAARAGGGGGPLADEVRAVLGAAGWTAEPPRTTGAVRERWESLAALVALADELPGDPTLSDFVAELDARASVSHAPVADAVTLASIHSAKGLEWRVVFVVGCSDGLLPLLYAETPEQVEEERRLTYVAITRAADRLHLSWARSRQPGGRATRNVSRFLAALPSVGGGPAPAGGVSRRGSGKQRSERSRTGPATCRVCRKALVTPPERTLGRCQTCPSDIDVELLDALRAWRLETSRAQSVPAYVVFTDVTLTAVAEQRPDGLDALARIPGIGPKKLDAYGEVVLGLVRDHRA